MVLLSITAACQGANAQIKPDSTLTNDKKESLMMVEDGDAIIKPAVFEPGCYYGESLSDHAPIIYGELGTWNIGSPRFLA